MVNGHLDLLEKQLEKIKAQFKKTEEIHKSITGNRILETSKLSAHQSEGYIRTILPPPAKIEHYLLEEYQVPDRSTRDIRRVLTSNELDKKPQSNARYKEDRE
ncbi:hypothetical protein, partial [Bartonella sp. AC66GZZY]|uniref:hypothetical protein n=1 Tax=Bartonella sp. AC66GZZY TaxID=3243458 RepID=UPI0035CF147A